MTDAVAWAANAVLVVGLWQLGKRRWHAFALTAVGEVAWVGVAAARREWDLTAMCVVFAVLAVRNLVLWRRPDPAAELRATPTADLEAELVRRRAAV